MSRAVLFLGAWVILHGQNAAPSFEVASVRAAQPGVDGMAILCENGRFTVYHNTLKELIQLAWRVRDFQVIGGPGWMDSAQFYIAAKAAPGTPGAQCPAMVQALLAERFKLAIRGESRQLPVYSLVVDPKGVKFHESASDTRVGITGGPGQMKARKISMGTLAQSLSRQLDRPVLDRTGLAGRYDFDLSWAPENDPTIPQPSIFTAVEDQLGLKLETAAGPVDVLVIEHAEKPEEN